jgi:hypothetical protein
MNGKVSKAFQLHVLSTCQDKISNICLQTCVLIDKSLLLDYILITLVANGFHIEKPEKVQMHATKFIEGISKLSYEARSIILELPTF